MSTTAHSLGTEHEHLHGLRVHDLVAKTARVTLKDTVRVMLSLALIAEFLDIDIMQLLTAEDFPVDRPSAEEAQLCEEAFRELGEAVRMYDNPRRIEHIRAID